MKRSFSFTEKPILFIIRQLPMVISGIDKVVTIYFDHETSQVSSYSVTFNTHDHGYSLDRVDVNDVDTRLWKFRSELAPYSWIRKEDIPFEISSNQKVQLSIFNELDNKILLVRSKNVHDNLSDLFFIYLNPNLSNFGITNSSKPLSTENKTIIGQLLYNSIQMMLRNSAEDREVFSLLQENNNQVIQNMIQLKGELTLAKEKYKNGIIHLSRNYLDEISREMKKNYRLSPDAISKLKEFDGDLVLLKPILEAAARFAETLHYESDNITIEIFDFHLVFIQPEPVKQQQAIKKEEIPEVHARYTKTLLLLNKLETAANNLKVKNMMLTSLNVANEFPSPVSPSAITDALKKHRSKILYLFKEFPGRWETIRSEFRPVQNILNPRQEREKNIA